MSNNKAKITNNNGKLDFEINNSNKEYSVYYSLDHNYNDMELLYKGNLPKFSVDSPSDSRMFFKLITDDQQEYNFSNRIIDNINIVNFRDLGGYSTSDGKRVKWGKFYRSAHLADINNDDESKINTMQISTVFDFRSPNEVLSTPNIIPNGVNYLNHSGISIMNSDKDLFSKEENANLDMVAMILKYYKQPEYLKSITDFLPSAYQSMVENPGAFAVFLNTIKNSPDKPIIFHCSAGKDRTGFAASLILSLLGVPYETILDDYLLSNHCRKDTNDALLAGIKENVNDPEVLKIVSDMLLTSPELLDIAYKTIDNNYGSIDLFFKNEVGFTKNDIAELKNIYLE